jgi:hypothetical protein
VPVGSPLKTHCLYTIKHTRWNDQQQIALQATSWNLSLKCIKASCCENSKMRFGLVSRRFMEAQYEEHSKTNVVLPIAPMTGSQLELALWFHYYLHWPAPYLPYQSTNKKSHWFLKSVAFKVVGPPGLEPGTKGLWAASINKTSYKSIGYAWSAGVWKQM